VTLLKYAQGQPWFAPYFASLPVAGVDGNAGSVDEEHTQRWAHSREDWLVEHVRTRSGLRTLLAGGGDFFVLSNNQGGKTMKRRCGWMDCACDD